MAHHPDALCLTEVTMRYRRGSNDVLALDRVSLTVGRAEFVAIVGPSGSGKSTLLNLIAGLDAASSGTIAIEGRSLSGMSDDALTDLRRTRLGVIFQFFNLLPNISALGNVALPLRAAGMNRRETTKRAQAALELIGLNDRAAHFPEELSGGEMQRVAVARALVIDPAIILADEPTGNLDSVAAEDILRTIRRCNKERAVAVVLVTHSPIAAAYGDRVITLHDGRVVDEVINRPPKPPRTLHPVSSSGE